MTDYTTVSIRKDTKAMLDAERPSGTPWDAFFRDTLGLDIEEAPLSTEETERAIEAVAALAEDAGVATAEEFSEAVTERLEEVRQ